MKQLHRGGHGCIIKLDIEQKKMFENILLSISIIPNVVSVSNSNSLKVSAVKVKWRQKGTMHVVFKA
jgi:hypothetical protein